MGSVCSSSSSTSANPQALGELGSAWDQTLYAAQQPYKPYQRQMVAPLNTGQTTAINQLQGGYGMAQPYINAGAGQMAGASASLGNVNNYLQASSGALGKVQGYMDQAAQYATPGNFDPSQYMNPYQQSVIDTTMAWAKQNDAAQMSSLVSNSIGNGAYGGDRNGIAVGTIAGQQAMANDSTVANLNAQNYAQATAQWNQMQADRYQSAGIYSGLGQMAGQSAQQYGALGQLEQQTGIAQGNLGNAMAGLGTTAQSDALAGASAGLQGSTLQQQYQQQQDAARYAQFQQRQSYPFQTAGFLANIANGQAANMGSTTTQQGSILSSLVGAGALGLGIMNTSSGLTPKLNDLGAGHADGGRIGYAGGGNVGLAAAMRPHYDVGGALFNPAAGGIPYAANDITAANPLWGRITTTGGGAGGAGAPGVARVAQPSSVGIGALTSNPASMSSAGAPAASSDDSTGALGLSKNADMGLIAAGLGIMGGGSGNGIENIGRGGLQGLQTYLGLQQQDANNAYRQHQMGLQDQEQTIKQGEFDITKRQSDQQLRMFELQLDAAKRASQLDADPTGGSATSSTPAPATAPSASNAPSVPAPASTLPPTGPAMQTPPMAGGSGTDTVTPAATAPLVPTVQPTAPMPTAPAYTPSTAVTSLNRAADVAMQKAKLYSFDPATQQKYVQQSADFRRQATEVQAQDPNYLSYKTSVEANARDNAGFQTAYDQTGNETKLDTPTYRAIVAAGGTATVGGRTLTVTQNPMLAGQKEGYQEWNKNAIAYQKDAPEAQQRIQDLAKIYATDSSSGPLAQRFSELSSYARNLGVGDVLQNANIGNSEASYDAAKKLVADAAMHKVGADGVGRAPGVALKMAALTQADPSMAPAARFSVLARTQAGLEYDADMNAYVHDSGSTDIYQKQREFAKTHNMDDYVNKAAMSLPAPAGATPDNMRAAGMPSEAAYAKPQTASDVNKLRPGTKFIIPDGSGRFGTVPGAAPSAASTAPSTSPTTTAGLSLPSSFGSSF